MLVLGLTGSIGMGKTTVAGMFAETGVPVFDSDAAVHRLYAGPAASALDAAFPGVVRDGAVDRALLAGRVLGDAEAMKRLEAIVHPLVKASRDAFLAEARRAGAEVVVIDVPLLFETGGEDGMDAVAVVSAPESVQKARVLARPGMTEAKFSAILARQMPDAEKRRRATFVIETGRGLEDTRDAVRRVLSSLREGQPPMET